MDKSFEGKVVVVTGANSGIGEAAALAFQRAGARVFGVARRKQAVDAARTQHPEIHWLLADVTRADQIQNAIESVLKEAGRLDVLVNNAGIGVFTPLDQSKEADVRAQFETNVLGTTLATQAALPALKASQGSIVNIGSAAGHKPAPGASHYAATKAALESLTRSWALELASQNIRVNMIAPGPTDTPVFAKIVPPEAVAATKAHFTAQVPLGRMASSEEVARWIAAISDPTVTWITGQILSVDGGMSLT
ncbi:MAG TPA: SDR family oxidoreductase [Polyangiales bacterium]|jgi:NAD(P)-dependent dehydrogenase (short-subunit alcohol dehydrogenase family)